MKQAYLQADRAGAMGDATERFAGPTTGGQLNVHRRSSRTGFAIVPPIHTEPAPANRSNGADHEAVRQVGTKTFYFKGGRWLDSLVKPEDEAKAQHLIQFSDEYFRLAEKGGEIGQYLAIEEPATFKIGDTIYAIDCEPSKN
jgi:Ca-activated chloride channel family protein